MNPKPAVHIDAVSKVFPGAGRGGDDVAAVDGVTFDIPAGEFFALLGPSGCGKTTLLRMIAGLEQPTAGRVYVDGADVTDVPPHRRPVNLVFQHYALFPHLSVERNVAFGLRYRGVRGAEAHARVEEALKLVRLEGYSARRPDQLSGGQRQRVALARALVLRPKVLLLDEPFGALDQKLRREMQLELKRLQRSLGITFVFVTHDQEEALTMSDRIAVMNRGRVEQLDDAEHVFERPRTPFVADFMGAANFFEARVVAVNDGVATLASDAAGYRTDVRVGRPPPAVGRAVRFVVRPEKIWLRASPEPGLTCVAVDVEDRVYQGVSILWTVRTAGGERIAVYDQNDEPPGERGLVPVGGKAWACWDPRHAVVLEEAIAGATT
jgi:spermidine/putrescine transport system ATP-binding protein